jgi:hypothetical protein
MLSNCQSHRFAADFFPLSVRNVKRRVSLLQLIIHNDAG